MLKGKDKHKEEEEGKWMTGIKEETHKLRSYLARINDDYVS